MVSLFAHLSLSLENTYVARSRNRRHVNEPRYCLKRIRDENREHSINFPVEAAK